MDKFGVVEIDFCHVESLSNWFVATFYFSVVAVGNLIPIWKPATLFVLKYPKMSFIFYSKSIVRQYVFFDLCQIKSCSKFWMIQLR